MSNSKQRLTDKTYTKKTNEIGSIIKTIFGFDLNSVATAKDADIKKLTKQSEEATTQNKRAREGAKQFKKLLHSRVSLVKITNGLLRDGLDALKAVRREESKTVKHLAKVKGSIRVIDEKTSKAVELAEYATNKEIANIGEQAERGKQLVDQRYSSLSEVQQAQHSSLLDAIQAGASRRIEQSKTPWK